MESDSSNTTPGLGDPGPPAIDLIRSIAISMGKLSTDRSDEQFERHAISLGKEFSLSTTTVKNISALSKLHTCVNFRSVLQDSSNFRVMRRDTFVRGMESQPDSKRYLPFELLKTLLNGSDSQMMTEETGWGKVVGYCSRDATNLLTLLFLAFVVHGATLCGWFGAFEEPTVEDLCNVLREQGSNRWGTGNMLGQLGQNFSPAGMCSGWKIAEEVMKMKLDELNADGKGSEITSADIESAVNEWTMLVLQEVLVWMCLRIDNPRKQLPLFKFDVVNAVEATFWKLRNDVLTSRATQGDEVAIGDQLFHRVLNGLRPEISIAEVLNNPNGKMELRDGRKIHRQVYVDLWRRIRKDTPKWEGRQAEKGIPTWMPLHSSSEVSEAHEGTVSGQRPFPRPGSSVTQFDRTKSIALLSERAKAGKNYKAGQEGKESHGGANNARLDPARNTGVHKHRTLLLGARRVRNALDYLPADEPRKKRRTRFGDAPGTDPIRKGPSKEKDRPRDIVPDPFEFHRAYGGNVREMRNCLSGYPEGNEKFTLDVIESDNEEVEDDEDSGRKKDEFQAADAALDLDFESLLGEVTYSNLNARDKTVEPRYKDMIYDNGSYYYLEFFLGSNREYLSREATQCKDSVEYANLFKCLLYLEIHFSISEALHEVFPSLSANPERLENLVRSDEVTLLELEITNVQPSCLLMNMKCLSSDPKLNEKLVEEFSSMTVCVGYFKDSSTYDKRPDSPVMLLVCRSISYEEENVDKTSPDRSIDEVRVKLIGNRALLEMWQPMQSDLVYLKPLTCLASYHRMFRGVHDICRTSSRVRQILFGDLIPQLPGVEISRKGREVIDERTKIDSLRRGVDAACLNYIDGLGVKVANQSQKKAIMTSLREMGDLGQGSSSISLVVGPPGTGKTTCIGLLIASLMHHSKAGHIYEGAEYRNLLKHNDNMLRCSFNPMGVRILICCSSNHAVDNCARKIKQGIPDGRGGMLYPEVVRIGRHKYDYGDLLDISLRQKAIRFDEEHFNPNANPPLRHPSSKAKKAMAKECIVYACTLSTTGSACVKHLGVHFDVVIIDEAAHASEPESAVAMSLAATKALKGTNRLHVVLFGDHLQLPPVIKAEHPVKTFLFHSKFFQYRTPFSSQIRSMFERLLDRKRCPVTWLREQYRMHPDVARIQFKEMYGDKVLHPSSSVPYTTNYNTSNQEGRIYAPFTFVDTLQSLDRRELDLGKGNYINLFEVEQVDLAIRNVVETRKGDELRHGIFVTAPYKSQVSRIREHLYSPGNILSYPHIRNSVDIHIGTVDSLQGMERPIVILSLTRSNCKQNVGFLCKKKRIIVATSRAKNLLVIIGDSSTVCASVPMVRNYWMSCFNNMKGTSLRFVKPAHGRSDAEQVTSVTEWSKNYRTVTGYNLRRRT